MAVILIVDDEPMFREVIAAHLSNEGYETTTAQNGLEAVDRFHAVTVDAIVTDIQMPELDGISFIQQLRSAGHTVPVIVMTAARDIRASDLSHLNVHALLSKPFHLSDLSSLIRQLK
jgi:CheY-like chemotaxis protein